MGECARELAEHRRAPEVGELLLLDARILLGALAARDVGAGDDGAALRAPQALDRDLDPGLVHAGGLEVLELAARLAPIEHIPQRRQVLRRVALTEFGCARAGIEVAARLEHAVEAGRVRELHAAPPGFVDFDDRARGVEHRDLVVHRPEHRGMQSLGTLEAGLGAAERREVERVQHAAAVAEARLAEDHGHALAVGQRQVALGHLGRRLAVGEARGELVDRELAIRDLAAVQAGERHESLVRVRDLVAAVPDRGRDDVVLEDLAEARFARGERAARVAPFLEQRRAEHERHADDDVKGDQRKRVFDRVRDIERAVTVQDAPGRDRADEEGGAAGAGHAEADRRPGEERQRRKQPGDGRFASGRAARRTRACTPRRARSRARPPP